MRRLSYPVIALILSSVFLPTQSIANKVNEALFDLSLEELLGLTVNTRKFDELHKEVPKSYSLVSKNKIAKHNINSVHELSEFVPNLSFRKSFGRQRENPTARGISNLHGDPVVGILIDGQAHSGLSTRLPLFDMEQIEVMKSPEVAYYGRSTFAGAINFVPIKPTFSPYTEAAISVAQHGEVDAHVISNVKLSSKLAALVSARSYKTDNNIENSLGNTESGYGKEESSSVALSALWIPNKYWEFYFRIASQSDEDGHVPVYLQSSDLNNCSLEGAHSTYCGTIQAPDDFGYNESDLFSLGTNYSSIVENYRVKWGQDNRNIQLTYSKSNSDMLASFDSDFSENHIQTDQINKEYETDTIELIGRMKTNNGHRIIIGTSRYHLDTQEIGDQFIHRDPQSPIRRSLIHFRHIENVSFFLGYDLPIAKNTNATIDIRYSKDDVSYGRSGHHNTVSGSNDWDWISPKLTVSRTFDHSPAIIYTSLSSSQKPGGFNGRLEGLDFIDETEASRALEFLHYDEEILNSYEIGYRNEIFNNNAWLDSSLFYNDWQDLQLTRHLSFESTLGTERTSAVINGVKAYSYGGEIELNWEISQLLTLRCGLGYAKSILAKATNELIGNGYIDGMETPNWPTFNGNIILDYQRDINSELQFFSSTSFTYEDERFMGEQNLAIIESSEKLGLTVGIRNDNWSVSLWAKQLNDDQAIESAVSLPDLVNFSPGIGLNLPEQRQFGFTVRVRN
ncbi:TonB-dependent receptor plug domain-containing protein [Puniceicoccaceae bacterium K14]|nr:TonB-dependent receptor plug domain-containing protein [Puniceicoccaceae bacterium K14]